MRCPRCGEPQPPGRRSCSSCGGPLLQPIALRLFALSDDSGRSFPLRSGITRIGRDPASNEIVLTDEFVSERHAAIEVSPEAVVIRDLGSDNGTRVNGAPIQRAAVLETGDVVTFGDRALTLTRQPAPQSTALRGIPVALGPSRQQPAIESEGSHLPTALAVIALTLLATMLHGVGILDGVERDTLPLPLPLMLLGLVVLPLAGIGLLAAGKRSGYLVTAAAALAGLAFVAVAEPIFSGGGVRGDITSEYGPDAFWFIAVAAGVALIVEILALTVSLAGWRALQPDDRARTPARAA